MAKSTIGCYARALRRVVEFTGSFPDEITQDDLKSYFQWLLESYSWATIKTDRCPHAVSLKIPATGKTPLPQLLHRLDNHHLQPPPPAGETPPQPRITDMIPYSLNPLIQFVDLPIESHTCVQKTTNCTLPATAIAPGPTTTAKILTRPPILPRRPLPIAQHSCFSEPKPGSGE